MKTATATAIVFLVTASPIFAHEGGSHGSVKGTVRSMGDREIVIRTTDGKERTIVLDDDTECVDRQGDASCSDVKAGDRVVVSTRAGEEGRTVADEIKFSHIAGKGSADEQPKQDHHQHSHSPQDDE